MVGRSGPVANHFKKLSSSQRATITLHGRKKGLPMRLKGFTGETFDRQASVAHTSIISYHGPSVWRGPTQPTQRHWRS